MNYFTPFVQEDKDWVTGISLVNLVYFCGLTVFEAIDVHEVMGTDFLSLLNSSQPITRKTVFWISLARLERVRAWLCEHGCRIEPVYEEGAKKCEYCEIRMSEDSAILFKLTWS